jgi:hypothetical protein
MSLFHTLEEMSKNVKSTDATFSMQSLYGSKFVNWFWKACDSGPQWENYDAELGVMHLESLA